MNNNLKQKKIKYWNEIYRIIKKNNKNNIYFWHDLMVRQIDKKYFKEYKKICNKLEKFEFNINNSNKIIIEKK